MSRVELKVNHLKPNSNYILDYLTSLGIAEEDVNSFIGTPRNEDEEDPLHLDNIQKAVDEVYEGLTQNKKFFCQVDADCDGFTSSAEFIAYVKTRFPEVNIIWNLHEGKEHGINMKALEEINFDVDYVIVPDAGSNEYDKHQELASRGIKVIVLDHHEISDIEGFAASPAIIVNNQTSANYRNKSLSGAGVVYKFIKQMDKTYYPDDKIYQNYGDLATIGIIADAMKMTTLDNNYLAYWGLSNIHNKFIKALAVKQARGIKNPEHLTKIDVAFYLAPVINGVIRSGSEEDKSLVFKAMCNPFGDNEMYDHTWRGVTTQENLYEHAVRLAVNAKSRQDAAVKKAFDWLCGDIREQGLNNNNIIIVALDKKQSTKVTPNITGLIAMKLVKEFNKPCLVLRETEFEGDLVFGGSGRNGNFYNLPDLKAALNGAGARYAEGHGNAFGAFLNPNQIGEITAYFNDKYNIEDFSDVFEVDYWFRPYEDVDTNMLMEMANYEWLWGNSIPQPKFAVEADFTADQLMIMGADKSSVKIKNLNGVDCVAFKDLSLVQKLSEKQAGRLLIVGRPQINEWLGKKTVQLIIDDLSFVEVKAAPNFMTASDLL